MPATNRLAPYLTAFVVVTPVVASAVQVTKKMSIQKRIALTISHISFNQELKQKKGTRAVGSSFKTYNDAVISLLKTFDTAVPDVNFFTCTPIAVHKLAPRVQKDIAPVIDQIYKTVENLGAENALHYSWKRIATLEELAKNDPREKVRLRAEELKTWLKGERAHTSKQEEESLWWLARFFEKGGADGLDKGSSYEASVTLLDKRRTQHRNAQKIDKQLGL